MNTIDKIKALPAGVQILLPAPGHKYYYAGFTTGDLNQLREKLERYEKALGQYADATRWLCPEDFCDGKDCDHRRLYFVTNIPPHGYDIAAQALAEVDEPTP